ncbi:hypothetical protein BO86DRAFT_421954 [Aspergillus japonicus CBS 114.51]|uniref:Ell binding protein Ebp1 C-terminal domain-containing protein n=2 Tax=Aspergillus TaxID=5052 RepID=A0A2V5H5Q2_ASPV1|nr:hypothetical protein BO86DRAFT_421954 [Aspergillus japonicus CBS 114.51]PYI16173.1 hypothetical protein BO99DRAFT_340701 [Aspergillus violaceofuscus CBS 115571]RAH77993.1 hypothetical protein BO86DRAFT_421954 [Aspergillus japonicus CBS 114.51]
MSGEHSLRPANAESRGTKRASEHRYNLDQDSIDRRLKRLKDQVLPLYPFLLTVPTDVPFRLGGRFVNNWAVSDDGPFTPEEQQLQYMTFLTHHDGESLLAAVGDWSDSAGNVMSDQQSGPQSAASTPSYSSLKKKISLNDYKNRRKSGAPSGSPVSREAPSQSSTAQTHNGSQSTNKASGFIDEIQGPAERAAPGNVQSSSGDKNMDRKRPLETDNEPMKSTGKGHVSLKKNRLSTDSTVESTKVGRLRGNGLPALLSPTLPPVSSSPRLPRLLSPTLPPDLEKELSMQNVDSVSFDSLQHPDVTNIDASNLQKAKSAVRGSTYMNLSPISSRQNKTLNSGSVRRSSVLQEPSDVGSSRFTTTKVGSQHLPKESVMNSVDTRTSYHSSHARTRFIVRLRYGRANRKRVEALLKFSGKRKIGTSSSPVRNVDISHATISGQSVAKATASERAENGNKLSRNDFKAKNDTANMSSKECTKESKPPIIIDQPQSPKLPSPHTKQILQDRSKQMQSTSRKSVNCSGQYEVSGDTSERMPPQSGVKHTAEWPTPTKPPSPQTSSAASRQCERRAWKEEYQKYGNLGRELKHAAERHTAKDNATVVDEKLAVATAVEAILCFILAFVADDHFKALNRQVADSSSWLSILAYWRVVKKNSAPYPRLHSLCLMLGAVSYDAIHALDLERLAVTPVPEEHTAISTSGSDETAVSLDDYRKARREFNELKHRLPECYRESQKLWLEGSRGLSENVLASEFPATWSNRSKNFSEQGKPLSKAGDLSIEYFLPLRKTSTPSEIISFSCAILKEWCTKEGIGWRSRLDV